MRIQEFAPDKVFKALVTARGAVLKRGGTAARRISMHSLEFAPIPTYDTVRVDRGAIQTNVTATGNLNAVVDVLVSSQVSGSIKALYADWNSKVKKASSLLSYILRPSKLRSIRPPPPIPRLTRPRSLRMLRSTRRRQT
jgi:multidrug efflux pump subunit AcrA (membrane-fusion protein)